MYSVETRRLLLRRLEPGDARDFFLLNQDPEVLRYTGDLPFPNLEAARVFLEGYDQYRLYGLGRWAVCSREEERFVGWCGLRYDAESGETDIGFRFFRAIWGRGYASEAAEACLAYGFDALGLERIVARAMAANTASIRVLEKIGMEYVKTINFDGHPGVFYEQLRP